MLSSDEHFRIGGVPFAAATDQTDHYVPNWSPKPVTRNDIPGSPGDETLEPDLREWRMTDWSGGEVGESSSQFDPNDPTAYQSGLCNPRIPGQLSGPPIRTGSTPGASANTPTFGPFLGASNSYLWLLHYQKVQTSTDGSTWTDLGSGAGGGTRQVTHKLCSDGTHLFSHAHDTPHGSGTWELRAYNKDAVLAADKNVQVATFGAAVKDGCITWQAGTVFKWTGQKLRTYDVTDFGVFPYVAEPANNLKFNTGGDGFFPTTYYIGIVPTDGSVAFFYSAAGETFVYEYRSGVGAQLTTFLNGFTCHQMTFYLGNLWFVGEFNGQAALFKYDYSQGRGSFVNYISRGSSLTPVDISPGPGDQLGIVMATGEVYIVDHLGISGVQESISELDVRTGDGTANAFAAYQNLRLAAMGAGSTVLKVSSWGADTAATTQTGNLTSSEWNYDLPTDQTKILVGFNIEFVPITGAETIVVKYGIDGAAATTTTVSTITSATSGAANGFVFLPVSTGSSTVTFRRLRWQVTVTGGAVIKAVDPVMYPIGKVRRFKLLLGLRDHDGGAGADQKRAGELYALCFGEVRDSTTNPNAPNTSNGLLSANSVVTFDNGYPYSEPDVYDRYVAVIERASFTSTGVMQGIADVTLRVLR